MNTVSLFRFDGQQVRTVIIDGEPWFVAVDVARVLGYSATEAMTRSMDADEKGMQNLQTPGGIQSVTVISEPGLYEGILRSRVPAAREFKRWVKHEVLPQIRSTGQFGSQLPGNFAEALELAAVKVRELEAAEQKIASDAPKVAAFDQLMDSEGFYTMETVAKLGRIGRTTLFNRLREAGVIQSGSRLPYQRYMHWFKITTSSWLDGDGVSHLSNTARVLPSALMQVLGKAGVDVALLDGMEQARFDAEAVAS